ncbi:uncharacterized protein B0P05DRAFT_553455 [Gilbertella persicaria]|uniref:uncharacterized protein n=1 Tax=Gilbertella persicaria TaxID=101096 RepID=UPI002220AE7A|nr:uncharacterized protein B0P05DRAFT_553455 [Gilbertella persicaria]KAI8066224.1 hypothetical protein B0P05DRAFT_553455 [Gilbertella persicaria]
MDYDPKHKASSITSTTSTSSSQSTWDYPLSSNNPLLELESEDVDYHFSERISIPPFIDLVENNSAIIVPNDKQELKVEHLTPIYLQHADCITIPHNITNRHYSSIMHRRRSIRSQSPSPSISEKKRLKLNRDILTDDEKRVNHIASEQKRRNTIRLGFKELTDMIPTLKNINNSKSTILFKAVEYIKHLDKRNRNLRDKLSTLQLRIQVEGRTLKEQRPKRIVYVKQPQIPKTEFSHLPPNAVSALLAHKQQQRQLEELQEQLRAQQRLLVKHNILPDSLAEHKPNNAVYHSILIPSSHDIDRTPSLMVPQDL